MKTMIHLTEVDKKSSNSVVVVVVVEETGQVVAAEEMLKESENIHEDLMMMEEQEEDLVVHRNWKRRLEQPSCSEEPGYFLPPSVPVVQDYWKEDLILLQERLQTMLMQDSGNCYLTERRKQSLDQESSMSEA
jgi:hypothetical protein